MKKTALIARYLGKYQVRHGQLVRGQDYVVDGIMYTTKGRAYRVLLPDGEKVVAFADRFGALRLEELTEA